MSKLDKLNLRHFQISYTAAPHIMPYYAPEEISRVMSAERFALFQEWMRGQTTLSLPDGKVGIYIQDLHHFIDGLPPLD